MRMTGTCTWGLRAFAAFFAIEASMTMAADRYVSPGLDYGSGAGGAVAQGDLVYSSLQAAVSAASAGDTVWVKDGFICDSGATMYGMSNRVYITKAITIRSQSGSWEGGAAIVGAPDPSTGGNGDYATRCVQITAAGVSLIGFRLENGYVKSGNTGGAVFSQTAGGRVENCFVSDCRGTALSASQYAAKNKYIEVVKCVVTNNVVGLAYCVATNSVIACNSAGSGSGGAHHCALTGCQIVGNVSSNDNTTSYCRGGGVANCAVTNCVLVGNRTYSGSSSGVYARGGGAYDCESIVGCIVSNNWAKGLGGGLSGCRKVLDSVIVDNTASTGGGAEINSGVVSNCVFRGNVASGSGGGLYASDGAAVVDVYASVFTNNAAGATGGGIRYNSASGWATKGEIVDCTITGNRAVSGGGGVHGSSRKALLLRGCTVSDNILTSSSSGGGGLLSAYAEDSVIENNTILARTSSGKGGGGTRDCTLFRSFVRGNDGCGATGGCAEGELTNCVVCCNFATNADVSAWVGTGGGISGSIAVGCVVSNNLAIWRGGGTYGGTSYNCLIVGNKLLGTGNSGGATCWEGSYFNCTIAGNTVTKGPGGFFSCANVANTISWGNTGTSTADKATTVTNSCVAKLDSGVSAQAGVVSSDPRFRATEGAQAYRLRGSSPCKGTGVITPWMYPALDERAFDVVGKPLSPGGGAPSMGCYAYETIGLRVLVR